MAYFPVSNRSRNLTELPPNVTASNNITTSNTSVRSRALNTGTFTKKQRLQNAKNAINDPNDISFNVSRDIKNEYTKTEEGEPFNQYTTRFKLLMSVFVARGIGLGRSENLSKVILNQVRYKNEFSPYTMDMIEESVGMPSIPRIVQMISEEGEDIGGYEEGIGGYEEGVGGYEEGVGGYEEGEGGYEEGEGGYEEGVGGYEEGVGGCEGGYEPAEEVTDEMIDRLLDDDEE